MPVVHTSRRKKKTTPLLLRLLAAGCKAPPFQPGAVIGQAESAVAADTLETGQGHSLLPVPAVPFADGSTPLLKR